MQQIRILKFSSADGNDEGVFFTEDFDMPADDVCPEDMQLDSDDVVDTMYWPAAFPMNYILARQ